MAQQGSTAPAEQMVLWDSRLQSELRTSAEFGRRSRPLTGLIPSGSITIDAAIGIGGLPRGRMVEVFGPSGAGKTTIALQALAAAQQEGMIGALVDAERSFDAAYAARLGVDVEALVVVQAEDGDQALRIIEHLAASKSVDIIVLDSVAALASPDELRAAVGDGPEFGHSELVGNGLRRIARVMPQSPACLILLNQLRSYQGFGYDETSSGGWSVKLQTAVRADLREKRLLPGRARRMTFKIVKNQLAPTAQMEFDFVEGIGISATREAIELGLIHGVLKRDGSDVLFEERVLGTTAFEALTTLENDAELAITVNALVREKLGLPARCPVKRHPVVRESGAMLALPNLTAS